MQLLGRGDAGLPIPPARTDSIGFASADLQNESGDQGMQVSRFLQLVFVERRIRSASYSFSFVFVPLRIRSASYSFSFVLIRFVLLQRRVAAASY